MGIVSAYIGLSVAFILIVSILLYFVINSDTHVAIKAGLITIVVWYSLVLFYTPPKLMGWPTYQDLPDSSLIVFALVKEPRGKDLGGMYLLLLIQESNRTLLEQINPKNIFDYSEKNTPRLYRIPYDRELHKELMKKRKQAARSRGGLKLKKKKKKNKGTGRGKQRDKDMFKIELINPMEMLGKD